MSRIYFLIFIYFFTISSCNKTFSSNNIKTFVSIKTIDNDSKSYLSNIFYTPIERKINFCSKPMFSITNGFKNFEDFSVNLFRNKKYYLLSAILFFSKTINASNFNSSYENGNTNLLYSNNFNIENEENIIKSNDFLGEKYFSNSFIQSINLNNYEVNGINKFGNKTYLILQKQNIYNHEYPFRNLEKMLESNYGSFIMKINNNQFLILYTEKNKLTANIINENNKIILSNNYVLNNNSNIISCSALQTKEKVFIILCHFHKISSRNLLILNYNSSLKKIWEMNINNFIPLTANNCSINLINKVFILMPANKIVMIESKPDIELASKELAILEKPSINHILPIENNLYGVSKKDNGILHIKLFDIQKIFGCSNNINSLNAEIKSIDKEIFLNMSNENDKNIYKTPIQRNFQLISSQKFFFDSKTSTTQHNEDPSEDNGLGAGWISLIVLLSICCCCVICFIIFLQQN